MAWRTPSCNFPQQAAKAMRGRRRGTGEARRPARTNGPYILGSARNRARPKVAAHRCLARCATSRGIAAILSSVRSSQRTRLVTR
jgi:hypothetical protein